MRFLHPDILKAEQVTGHRRDRQGFRSHFAGLRTWWLTYSARSTSDKILAIVFPITAFVAASFEHSVANMYFIPFGLFIQSFDPSFAVAHNLDLSNLTWGSFLLKNLLPVTIGNIIGGAVLVAIMYWFIYLYPSKMTQSHPAPATSTYRDIGDGKPIKTRS